MDIHVFRSETGVTIKADWDKCDGIGACSGACPTNVFFIVNGKVTAPDIDSCMKCGLCMAACPKGALTWG